MVELALVLPASPVVFEQHCGKVSANAVRRGSGSKKNSELSSYLYMEGKEPGIGGAVRGRMFEQKEVDKSVAMDVAASIEPAPPPTVEVQPPLSTLQMSESDSRIASL